MSPRVRRIVIPLVVILIALGVVWAAVRSRPRTPSAPNQTQQTTPTNQTQPEPGATNTQTSADATKTPTQADTPDQPTETPAQPAATVTTALSGLKAIAPEVAGAMTAANSGGPPTPLGSLDPRHHPLRLDFTWRGAGIAAIPFSNIWDNAIARHEAQEYFESLSPGEPIDDSQLPQAHRYVLQEAIPYTWIDAQTNTVQSIQIPVLAAHSVVINGQRVGLLGDETMWAQTAPGRFETRIVDDNNQPVIEIARQFLPPQSDYGFTLQQRVRNVSAQPLDIQWQQYGPPELKPDTGYIDRRRFDLGYLPSPVHKPDIVLSDDDDIAYELADVTSLHQSALEQDRANPQRARELRTLWPSGEAVNYGLSWFASINRYFSLAVHPVIDAQAVGAKSLDAEVREIRCDVAGDVAGRQRVLTFFVSPMTKLGPGAEVAFDIGVYAGPLDRSILNQPQYEAISMDQMILYSMGGCCTWLTFQWLAHLLLWFLAFLHDYILFDWAMAIIALVCVVRALLHPLTKKSQINIQRFGKQMSAMKPEIDKIQKKYAGDPKKAQQEQMRLMREHGVNPLQMLGCLPMFLQMPIWIALWAMLYLAYEIWQQPAFYGIFQAFGNWQFLADLSDPDNFLMLPGGGFTIPFIAEIPSLNILPLLLGVVFWFQQKYMSPPPTPNMTPEQIQQQKIMKIMMVVMFPVFLYKAPSGLTLYIFTSTVIGIMESKYIRAHIDQMDLGKLKPPGGGSGGGLGGGGGGGGGDKPKKPKDPWARAFAEKLERARAKRKAAPPKTFKKRK